MRAAARGSRNVPGAFAALAAADEAASATSAPRAASASAALRTSVTAGAVGAVGASLDPLTTEARAAMERHAAVQAAMAADSCFLDASDSPMPFRLPTRAWKSEGSYVTLAGVSYFVSGILGSGVHGVVYAAQDVDKTLSLDDAAAFQRAIKVQGEPTLWEYYVLRKLWRVLRPRSGAAARMLPAAAGHADAGAAASATAATRALRERWLRRRDRLRFVRCVSHAQFSQRSATVMEQLSCGTLQQMLAAYAKRGARVEESVCMVLAVQMLRALEVMHAAGVVHADVKPDNWMLREMGEQASAGGLSDSSSSSSEGEEAEGVRGGAGAVTLRDVEREFGIVLIDFGRSIDLSLLPPGVQFTGDCHVSGFQCVEMLQGRPWTYQVRVRAPTVRASR